MFGLVVAYIRGWIAGKRDISIIGGCPYYLDLDYGLSSMKADVWIEAWCRASRRRFSRKRWGEQMDKTYPDSPF